MAKLLADSPNTGSPARSVTRVGTRTMLVSPCRVTSWADTDKGKANASMTAKPIRKLLKSFPHLYSPVRRQLVPDKQQEYRARRGPPGRAAVCEAICADGTLCTPTGLSGVSSAVERELPKLDVTGSIPVPRSNSLRPSASIWKALLLFPWPAAGQTRWSDHAC